MTDEIELRVARRVALCDHGVARCKDHLVVDGEESTKGLLASGVHLLGEQESLAKECFMGIGGDPHCAA